MGSCFPYVHQFATRIKRNTLENQNMGEKILVIHPNNSGFDDLDLLYYNIDVDLDTDLIGTSKLRKDIISHKRIMLLGSGNEKGLRSQILRSKLTKRFVDSSYAQFLRDKEIVGIFEDSKVFAKKYKLTGLFMGEILFDKFRAMREFFQCEQEELDQHKYEWCLDLGYLIRTKPWNVVQTEMKNLGLTKAKTLLERLNYSSLVYMINGQDIDETFL